jgi:sugar phosphate isomerase/epimerase
MTWTRRDVLAAGAGSLLGLVARADAAAARPGVGVVIHSYAIRRFDDPLSFLDHCRELGAAGVQTSLGVRDDAYADKLRAFAERHKLYVEGSIALPRDEAGVERFTAEVRTARRCGATLFRTVLMSGRRYEVFDSAEAYRKSLDEARQALTRARPVVEKHEVRMAVENHKDLRAPELVDLIKKMDSPRIGVCVDTGNNIALLEAPQETAELLAPQALTMHLKDMGVEEYADGFLMAEVPLGTGFLDLSKIVATLRKGRPDLRLNLEMITRDPLKIPCLTPGYWGTLESLSGRRLAEMLALVRAKAARKPLPRVSELTREKQLQREEENVRNSLRYARESF